MADLYNTDTTENFEKLIKKVDTKQLKAFVASINILFLVTAICQFMLFNSSSKAYIFQNFYFKEEDENLKTVLKVLYFSTAGNSLDLSKLLNLSKCNIF